MKPSNESHDAAVEDVQQTLYAKHQKIYPRKVTGLFANLKIASVLVLLGIFYIFPWIQWGERQAVLFDLPARQFYVFGLVFWPQDFIYLAFLLIIAGLSLFFFTALAGRLWCGFACPQTVWTEVFLWIERMVEGDRPQRMKLDKTSLDARKLRLKATKHTLWIVFSLMTGFTFIGYFTPIRELAAGLYPYQLSGWETFWMFFYGFATYGNAGWMREQVCTYMCPYARFQSAMFDKDTMIIAYDTKRGEPRGSRKRGEDYRAKSLGECIDCTMCVQVCPTGIDIRNGLQYQCISCSACIDICDEVMGKMNYPKGLIRYTTEHALLGTPTQIFRPRIFVYGGLLLLLMVILVVAVAARNPVQLDVIRDRASLYRETPEGLIENVYIVKAINKDNITRHFELTASGLDGIQVVLDREIVVEAGSVLDVPISAVVAPKAIPERSNSIMFKLTAKDDPNLSNEEEARFLGPVYR
jgi:cytochrome c oxidase accessory protein FixG